MGGASPDCRVGNGVGRDEASQRVAVSTGGVRRRRFEAIQTMRTEGLPARVACRVLGVSESGF